MNIREEIECYIHETGAWQLSNTLSWGIIEIIEKHIDKLIAEKVKLQENDDYDRLYFEAKIYGMKEVKELLK